MIYSPEIANPTFAVASAQVSAQVVKSCGYSFKATPEEDAIIQKKMQAFIEKMA